MRNARRLLAALLAVVMLIPSILVPGYAAETTSFKDVREDSWYADAVNYVSAAGYMKGTSKDAFSPGEDVTRAMFVTILSRVARAQTDNTVSAFGDVAANQYYSGAIEWAAEKEIVNGVGGGLFAPYRSITRQDLAVMLYRFVNAMGYELSEGESRTYTDEAKISAYAADAVRFVTSTGLFAGYQDGSFRPKATATRAQTAVIVMRLAQLLDGQIVDPEPMPAQSFDQTSEQMQVSVNAPEGALPENTKMTVSRVTDEAALAELASKVGAEVLGAADISFAKDGAELEPARKVNVRISLDAIQSAKNPAVVHVKDDGSFEYVSSSVVTTRGKADAIEFEADSFSVYAVLGGEGGSHTLTITFYARAKGSTGAWTAVNKQIIRADQLGAGKSAIADPGVPNITTSQAFEGWIYSEEAFNPDFTYTNDAESVSIKDINDYHNAHSLTADTEMVCYAAVYDVVYVTYHDQAGAVTSAEYYKIPAGSNSASVTINEDYPPMKSNQNFSGWVKEEMIDRPGSVDGTLPTYKEGAGATKWPVGSIQDLSENVDLYPYVEEGYWLSFNNNIAKNSEQLEFEDNTSAEYISPKFVPNGTTPTKPDFPSNDPRPGYNFVNWFADADMTEEFDFSQPLTQDTTVYAKWSFGTTSYRVLYWKQRATDAYDAADSAKEYDYAGSRPVSSVTTGTQIGINNTDTEHSVAENNENAFYFQFNSNKSDKTLAAGSTVRAKGDGTTVLNVYFDRKTITFRFGNGTETYDAVSSPDWSKYKYYVKSGSTYLLCERVADTSSYYTTYYYFTEFKGTMSSSGSYYAIYNNTYYPCTVYNGYWYINTDSGLVALTTSDTVYTSSTSEPSPVYMKRMTLSTADYTYKGLYGHLLPSSEWPPAGSGKVWSNYDEGVATVYNYPLALTEYVPTWKNGATPLQMDFYRSDYSTDLINVYYVGQSLTDTSSYDVQLATGTTSRGGSWFPEETMQGYTIRGYRFGTSGSWTSCTTDAEIKVSSSQTNDLYVAFNRNTYTLTYSSTTNTGTHTSSESIFYEKDLTDYKAYTPSDSYPGYYFAGWYLDEAGTKPFDLEKMPARNVLVYAKWNPKWYRVVVDYKRGNSSSVITVPGSTQKASFTVQYGSTIQTSSLMQAERLDADGNDNWMLVGLYLDEACTEPFNQNMQAPFGLTEADEIYPEGSRTGIDDITGETWSDEDYPDVRAKITLYAKWRVNPEGVVGIKVRYLGDHAENDKGYFDSNEKPHSMTLQNPVYTDGAKASAHSATVPSLPDEDTPDAGRRFLYWEILDKNGYPTGEIVYPGAPFTVDINKAVKIETPLPDPTCKHKDDNGAPTIVSVDAVAPTCTGTGVDAHFKCTKCGRLFKDANGADETTLSALTVPATGHDWETNDPTYEWSVTDFDEDTVPTCTATLVCHNNEDHILTETVTGQLIVNDDKTGYYLAEFEDEHFADQPSETFTVSRIAVTFKANGEIIGELTQLVTSGETVTLPGSEYLPTFTGYTFVGWVQAAVSDTTAAPAYKVPGDTSGQITADTTFIALYKREQATGGNVTVYKRVTEAPEDWTGNYVLTYLNTTSLYALAPVNGGSSYEVNDAAPAYADTGMRLENDKLYDVAQTYVFKFASRTNGYSMQSASNNTYVGRYVTTTANSAKLQSYSNYDSTYCRWTFDLQSAGNIRIQNVYSTNYDEYYPYIGFSSSPENSLHYCFWVDGLGQASTSNAALNMYLWKETTEPATQTHYTTTITTYTVTYSVPNGVEQPDPETVVQGNSIILPTEPEGTPSGYTFLGWTTDQTDNKTAQPATLTGEYTPEGTVTLYALYSFVEGSGGVEYNLVTAAPADWSGSYVITYGTGSSLYAMKGVSGSSTGTSIESENATALASTGMSLSGTKLTNVSDLYKFNVAKNGSYYTIRNASTNVYVGETSAYSLGGYTTYVSGYCDWTPGTGDNASSATIAETGSNYPYLSFNASNLYFWSGSTSNKNYTSVRWWKETPVGTTYYTTQIGSSGGGESGETTYTVTYMANGAQYGQPVTVTQGSSVTLPMTATTVTDWTFLGWVESAMTTTEGAPTYQEPGASITPNGNKTYYALYSKSEGGSGTSWEKASAVAVGDTVAIVCEGVSKELTGFNTNYSGSGSDYSGNPSCSYELNVVQGSTSSTIAFKDSNNNYITNDTSHATASLELTTSLTAASSWTVTFSGGNAAIKNASATTRQILWRAGSYNYFRVFASSNASNSGYYQVQLYKKNTSSGGTTTWTTNPGSGSNAVTQPKLASGEADRGANLINLSANANPNPVTAATDKYEKVTSLEAGEKYVLVFKNSSNADYIVTNLITDEDYGKPYAAPITITADGNYYTITTTDTNVADISNCQLKVGGSSGAWTLESLAYEGYYLGIYTTGFFYTSSYASYVESAATWDWNSSKKLVSGSNQLTWYYNSSNSYYYINLSNSGDAFDFYKLVDDIPADTYTVTVASDITNGTVRPNKTTAAADDTVTLYLTPSEGYEVDTVTVTDSDGTQIEVPGANGRYHFTMPASNVTVSATFKKVVANDAWIVSFADEDGKDIPGMNDIYVPKNNNELAESALPDSAKENYYFLGWYKGNDKCTFPMMVNSDIVLTPKYSPMFSYDYTLTLRAVYGPYNPDATTHIYWYANNGTDAHNGAGERYASQITVTEDGMTTTTTKLPINAQVDIPLPTGNTASQTVFVGDNGGALTWEDHVFLGWARVDNGGSADAAEARILTPDDIYLKWTGDHYEYRQADGTFSENWTMQKVYADETTPYHDMYAVWAGFYYIYHSSDGTLEAVQVPFKPRETKDLVAEAESKSCLYGGYYKSSGAVIGVDAGEMRAAKDSILNDPNFWNYTTGVARADASTSLIDDGAVEYDGSSLKNGDVRFWNKANAYTTQRGTELTPTAGTVYYLKEVPKAYLPNRLVWVKSDKDTTLSDGKTTVEKDEITNLYLMTALDDRNYADNGFIIGKAHSDQNVTSLDGSSGSANSLSRVFIIAIKKGDTYEEHHYNAHALNGDIKLPKVDPNANLVGFVAASNLGLEWIRANRGPDDGTATFYLKPYWTTLDGVTVEQNIMGVNISSNGKSISEVPISN